MFKSTSIYIDPKGNLLIFPITRVEMRGVTGGAIVDMDLPHLLNSPYNDTTLENEIQKALDECYSKKPDINSKSTPIEKLLNIKGWEKAVVDKKLIHVLWTEGEGYEVKPTRKEHKPKRGYSHMQSIKLGLQFAPGELSKAVKTAIDVSSG